MRNLRDRAKKPLKHGGTEVAEEKDLLAISSDPRISALICGKAFAFPIPAMTRDVGDYGDSFDGLNDHSLNFTPVIIPVR